MLARLIKFICLLSMTCCKTYAQDTTIDFSKHSPGQRFDQDFFYYSDGIFFADDNFVGFIQGDDALVPPSDKKRRIAGPITAVLACGTRNLKVTFAAGFQGLYKYTLRGFDISDVLVAEETTVIDERGNVGYRTLSFSQLSTPIVSFSLQASLQAVEVNNVPSFGMRTVEFDTQDCPNFNENKQITIPCDGGIDEEVFILDSDVFQGMIASQVSLEKSGAPNLVGAITGSDDCRVTVELDVNDKEAENFLGISQVTFSANDNPQNGQISKNVKLRCEKRRQRLGNKSLKHGVALQRISIPCDGGKEREKICFSEYDLNGMFAVTLEKGEGGPSLNGKIIDAFSCCVVVKWKFPRDGSVRETWVSATGEKFGIAEVVFTPGEDLIKPTLVDCK